MILKNRLKKLQHDVILRVPGPCHLIRVLYNFLDEHLCGTEGFGKSMFHGIGGVFIQRCFVYPNSDNFSGGVELLLEVANALLNLGQRAR